MSEIPTEKKITALQRKCIECLMLTGSISEAAAKANVDRSTIYKWHRQPAFVAALAEAEAEAVQSLSRVLAGLGSLAASALVDALASDQKVSTRLRASEIVLSNLLRLRELVNLEERIRALEANHATVNQN